MNGYKTIFNLNSLLFYNAKNIKEINLNIICRKKQFK